MKILIFNWRDTKNPMSGGAEIFTHEIAKHWADNGHKITIFTSQFPSCKQEEVVDGVQIVRSGNKYSVYIEAKKHYQKHFKGKYDVVIDQINTVPFFTPLYVKDTKIISFFHQLCREVWFYETSFPISLAGYLAESIYLRLYKKCSSIAVSQSTKDDLMRFGINNVSVVPEGINFKPLDKLSEKEKNTLIYVGRLKKSKRVHHIIKAISFIRQESPDIKLKIVGEGERSYEEYLSKLVGKNNLKDNVTFLGYIPTEKRNELMSKAEAIIVTSVKEGWGLIVTEANACGTPAIAYNVDGLRDSVKNGETGLLAPENNPKSLAALTVKFLNDSSLKKNLSRNALDYTKTFSWDKVAKEFMKVIGKVVGN